MKRTLKEAENSWAWPPSSNRPSWNGAAQAIFGCTAHEAIGQPVLMLIPLHRQAEEMQILAELADGKNVLGVTIPVEANNGAAFACTAFAMRGDEAKMRAAGCDGYLSEPLDVNRFGAQVRACMHASMRDDLDGFGRIAG